MIPSLGNDGFQHFWNPISGIWADDSEAEEEEELSARRRGRGKTKDYSAPVSFVAGGIQQAGKKKDQEKKGEDDGAQITDEGMFTLIYNQNKLVKERLTIRKQRPQGARASSSDPVGGIIPASDRSVAQPCNNTLPPTEPKEVSARN